jgi:hypothetical protein
VSPLGAVTLRPEPASWAELARARWGELSRDTAALRLREQLGLPTDRPVVMTGHQPGFWHGGILAKFVAARALAEQLDGAAAAVVVDQDDVDALALRVPTDRGAKTVRFGEPPGEGVIAGRQPPASRSADEAAGDLGEATIVGEHVRTRLRDAASRLADAADAGDAAMQATRANAAMLGIAQMPMLRATALLATDAGRAFGDALSNDAEGFADRYNAAVRAHPESGLTTLKHLPSRGRAELPLWRIAEDGTRWPVWSHMVGDDDGPMAPRAITMTGLLRRFACDVFIHGTGGETYDRVGEVCLSEWLGWELSPSLVATADVTLAIEGGADDEDALARAEWRRHRAQHDPALVGDSERAAKKAELVRSVEEAPQNSAARSRAFKALHALLAEHRAANARALDETARGVDEARRAAVLRELSADRQFPAIFAAAEDVTALRRTIASRLGAHAGAERGGAGG